MPPTTIPTSTTASTIAQQSTTTAEASTWNLDHGLGYVRIDDRVIQGVAWGAFGCVFLLAVWGVVRWTGSLRRAKERLARAKRKLRLSRNPKDLESAPGTCRRECMRCELQLARWNAVRNAAQAAGVDADSYAESIASPKLEGQPESTAGCSIATPSDVSEPVIEEKRIRSSIDGETKTTV